MMPCAAAGAKASRLFPQTPVSFCFLTTAWDALESGIAAWAASVVSGGAYPSGARSR